MIDFHLASNYLIFSILQSLVFFPLIMFSVKQHLVFYPLMMIRVRHNIVFSHLILFYIRLSIVFSTRLIGVNVRMLEWRYIEVPRSQKIILGSTFSLTGDKHSVLIQGRTTKRNDIEKKQHLGKHTYNNEALSKNASIHGGNLKQDGQAVGNMHRLTEFHTIYWI